MEIYKAKYTDKNGEVETTIRNDWKNLRMNLRDVEFEGHSFDCLEPEKVTESSKLETFTFAQDDLCECRIEFNMPIKIIVGEKPIGAELSVQIELGKSRLGGIDRSDVMLILSYDEKTFQSKGTSEWFEDELLDIQKRLPENHKIKCCFGCEFSDYSVYGHGFFGGMLCYRNIKEDYKKVSDKREFMEIMDKSVESVQETYLCPEFEIRKPERGYRG